MSSKQKKIFGTVTAVILVLVLGLAGTFAASGSTESDGNISENVDTSIVLHDDFSTNWNGDVRDRDVYVENSGDSSLYVRVRLDEFMKYGGKILSGAGGTKDDTSKWRPHIPAGKNITECGTEIHDYFTIQMGNDAGIKYKPGIQNAYKEGITEADKTGTTSSAKVVLIEDYLKSGKKPVPCWIVDNKDGYAYWHTQLKSNEATGLILNSITNTGLVDESYYYGINAMAEVVTEADLYAWLNGNTIKNPITGEKFDQASDSAVRLLKDMSPKYIKITEEMNLTTPPASDYDRDNDGYLTTKEYAEYQKLNPTLSLTDASAFPDEKLREALSELVIDKDRDKALTMGERELVVSLDLSNRGIKDLTGIDKFTNLENLDISSNHLTKINLDKNTQLKTLDVSGQTAEIQLMYDNESNLYKSEPGLFGPGTTFGKAGITYDKVTGAAYASSDIMEGRFDSTFSAPFSFGKSRTTGYLEGTVTFKKNQIILDVKAADAGTTVSIQNADKSTTDWIILCKNEQEATLITKNMITVRKYHNKLPYPTWPLSDIRNWLNSEGEFTGNGYMETLGEDLKQILKTEELKTAHAYNNWGTLDISNDRVYLLTETKDNSGIVAKNPGENALITKGQMKCSTMTDDGKSVNLWWLRSPRAFVNSSFSPFDGGQQVKCETGELQNTGLWVTDDYGVRPAVTIRLD